MQGSGRADSEADEAERLLGFGGSSAMSVTSATFSRAVRLGSGCKLEDETDVTAPVEREIVLVGIGELSTVKVDAARARDVEAAQDVEQRGFPAS